MNNITAKKVGSISWEDEAWRKKKDDDEDGAGGGKTKQGYNMIGQTTAKSQI